MSRDRCAEYIFRAATKRHAFGAALSAAHSSQTNAANRESTLNMGRRIMAERERKRGKRTRRSPRISLQLATAAIDPPGDDALRALVRVLARQAARELFESEPHCKAEVLH